MHAAAMVSQHVRLHQLLLVLDTVLHIVHACKFFACPHAYGIDVMACCVLQAAVVQQSCGMRTRNNGGGYQPAEGCQKKKGNKHITMQFLEQGGFFDVPIHVSDTLLYSATPACTPPTVCCPFWLPEHCGMLSKICMLLLSPCIMVT